MIKNHKWKAAISSVVILLPMVFGLIIWNRLPQNMVSHWGADGVADKTATKAFMVFGMPLILLALQWLMLLVETVLGKKRPQNSKIVTMQYVIVPVLSLVVHGFIYSAALEKEWNLFALIPVLIGILFLYIGNYLPKTTRNRTVGIKLRWTMGNDENWQKTHRLGGRIWFWGGLVMIASALLPVKFTVIVMVIMILISVIVPTVYSYFIYKKHRTEGVAYEPVFHNKSDKIALRITQITVPLILAGVAVLMFTGDISVTYTEADFKICASYMDDLTVSYTQVDSVEYRESFSIGHREMGYGSPRLSMGTFNNEEFGRYTLYAYTNGEGCVILRQDDRVLVLVGRTAGDTKSIYDTLSAKIK